MFEINQLTSQDIPILIVIIGALFLYFGGIIGSTKVEKYDKLGFYSEGLVFFAIFLYIPTLFAYYIYSKNLFMISSFMSLGIQVVILVFLLWNFIANEIKRHEMLDEIKKKVEERMNQIKEHNSFIRGREDWSLSGLIDLVYYKIPIKIFGNKGILIFFSFLTITSNIHIYESKELLIFGTSLLLAFIIFSAIALAHGFGDAYHPPGKIYMVDGTVIEGKILKFGDYVCVLKDDKKIFINNDKINYVEESKFKEKSN